MKALAVCAARRSQMISKASRRCGLAMSPLSQPTNQPVAVPSCLVSLEFTILLYVLKAVAT